MTDKTDREKLVEILSSLSIEPEEQIDNIVDAILQSGFVQKSTLLKKLGEMKEIRRR